MADISQHFHTLELETTATLEQAKEAYKDLVQVWHPDKHGNSPRLHAKAQEKLKDINNAYYEIQKYFASCKDLKEKNAQKRSEPSKEKTENTSSDPESIYLLAYKYYYGQGAPRNYLEAARLFGIAARQGHAKALELLGKMYLYGHGVGKDAAQALSLLQSAASKGNTGALVTLGISYSLGANGVQQDKSQSFVCFLRGAELGDSEAQYFLAQAYWEGLGVQKDREQSIEWLTKSAELGHPESPRLLKEITRPGLKLFRNIQW